MTWGSPPLRHKHGHTDSSVVEIIAQIYPGMCLRWSFCKDRWWVFVVRPLSQSPGFTLMSNNSRVRCNALHI